MSTRPMLEFRATMRSRIRDVFDRAGFVEVDTPTISSEVLPEAHIDPMAVHVGGPHLPPRYLQASPEALMKRLLAAGAGPIYQFARSFRAGERGRQHDLEFVLLEWYAPGTGLDETATILERLCAATLGTSGIERVSCADAFAAHAAVDPLSSTLEELMAAGRRAGLRLPESHHARPADDAARAALWDRWFEALLAEVVQPNLGRGRPAMLEAWPASQAALARLDHADRRQARRFELFVEGVELANGWEEETSRDVLADRIDAANRVRVADGRSRLPIPARLLDAHGVGMPDGIGAALGFDRLVMLAAGTDSIDAIRPFSSDDA
ncbi:MAG: amino acid--tRNA ligase-related protein [Planctomycetia bacterium]